MIDADSFPTTQIQTLGPNHTDDLKSLLAVFAEAFDDVPTYQRAVPNDQYLKRLLRNPLCIVQVALCDSRVVGGLVAYVLPKFEQTRSEVYIYDLAVDERYRRRGIATALINALKPVAREKGAYVIFVQADPPDEPAMALYESLGTRENVCHFDIDVSDS